MKTLNARDLRQMLDRTDDLTLINVLGESDFREEHIPGSHNILVDEKNFADRVEDLAGAKDATIVVYCASKDCQASPRAARLLTELGFTDVYDFEGGMAEWKLAGFDVEQGTPETVTS